MRIPAARRASVGFNMTPMIDIVFQLIIFFLVSSHLAQSQSQYELDLPSARGGQENIESTKTTKIIINVLPSVEKNGDYTILLAGEEVNLNTLGQKLSYEHNSRRQIEVHLRASEKTPFEVIEPILVACAQSGIWDVRFAVYEK